MFCGNLVFEIYISWIAGKLLFVQFCSTELMEDS
jgi:hypothetical protein